MPKKKSLITPSLNIILILIIVILGAVLAYIVTQSRTISKKLIDLKAKTVQAPSPDFEEWQQYTYNQGAPHGFTVSLPSSYYMLEKSASASTIKYFTVFPTPEEKKRIGLESVMEIEFNTDSGQIQFGSPQDTEWDRIYHGRVVRSFKLIKN